MKAVRGWGYGDHLAHRALTCRCTEKDNDEIEEYLKRQLDKGDCPVENRERLC